MGIHTGLSLSDYYRSLGLPSGKWHVGAEHPKLEEYAIELLEALPCARVLEVGYQSGGFAVPLIMAMHKRPDFTYTGVDSLAYNNAIPGELIVEYLKAQGIASGFKFIRADAHKFLSRGQPGCFDLILIDHFKPLYPMDLLAVIRNGLISPGGVVLMHDVLGRAQDVVPLCAAIARAYGFSWTVTETVPEGLAILRNWNSGNGQVIGFSHWLRRGYVGARVLAQRLKLRFGSAVRAICRRSQ